LIGAFAAGFQMPLVVLLLGWARIVTRETLAKFRRHAILINAILAAAIMPGDPASMISMLVPLCVLYELGGVLLAVFPAGSLRGRDETTEDEDDRA
jgi:sec-independent protein translocase protein TatC